VLVVRQQKQQQWRRRRRSSVFLSACPANRTRCKFPLGIIANIFGRPRFLPIRSACSANIWYSNTASANKMNTKFFCRTGFILIRNYVGQLAALKLWSVAPWESATLMRWSTALSSKALKVLIPFPTTYLSEKAFSRPVVYIKNKFRNRTENIKSELRLNLSSIEHTILEFLCLECNTIPCR